MATRSKARKKTTSKGATGSSVPAGDRYLDLVRDCPLHIIRSESEYGQAIAMLDHLSDLGNDRTSDETEYLLSLALFVRSTRTSTMSWRRFPDRICFVTCWKLTMSLRAQWLWERELQFPRSPKSLRASGSSQ